MLIATFGPATGRVGKKITHEGEVFVLERHGPISAADVMEYDRQGHLVWVNDGTRQAARHGPIVGSPWGAGCQRATTSWTDAVGITTT
jgi:hypothetical protein